MGELTSAERLPLHFVRDQAISQVMKGSIESEGEGGQHDRCMIVAGYASTATQEAGKEGTTTRWITTLSLNVNKPRAFDFGALCGANSVT